jgi:hypothetical protein
VDYLKTVEKYQPVLIGVLVFLLLTQKCSNDNFIEDREKEYKLLKDSLTTINTNLYKENEVMRLQNDSLLLQNDSLNASITRIDGTLVELEKVYVNETSSIDIISLDSNVSILSNYLSQDIEY